MTSLSAKSFTLTHDGVLTLRVEPELMDRVWRWLPFSAQPTRESTMGATIEVRKAVVVYDEDSSVFPIPHTHPTLRLGEVSVWIDDARAHAVLWSPCGLRGQIDLAVHKACIYISPHTISDLDSALTLTTALVFNRLNRVLIPAAAVVSPSGVAWLLIGDSHAGKTTTVANLGFAGWHYMSDDTVVLTREMNHDSVAPRAENREKSSNSVEVATTESGFSIEGWPRLFRLDTGWRSGVPQGGPREDIDPRTLLVDRWQPHASLGGLIFPTVHAQAKTTLEPISRGEAMALLLRQAPWLLADRATATTELLLITAITELPAYRLTLGLDTYHDLEQLLRVLEPIHSTKTDDMSYGIN
jgi:hypothetical protein